MSISRKIREERKRRKLTQGELAMRVGVSQSAVSKWESDAQDPDMASLIKLSAALDMPANWLIMGDGEEHPFDTYQAWGDIKVVGAVENYAWVDDPVWDTKDHFSINALPNITHMQYDVVGYVVRDDEAAPYFNRDSIVFITKPDYRNVVLKTGDYVVTAEYDVRRELYEVTIREIREVSDGNFLLLEPSLPEERPTIQYKLLIQPDGTAHGTRGGGDQLFVIGLVVASFRLEDALSRVP